MGKVGVFVSKTVMYSSAGYARNPSHAGPWRLRRTYRGPTVQCPPFDPVFRLFRPGSPCLDSLPLWIAPRQRLEPYGIDPTVFDPAWAMIEVLDGEEDRLLAHQVLTRDSAWSSRATAASVLANFSGHDAAWHGLMLTLTDPDGRVREVADAVLKGSVQADIARPVGWIPAQESLVALLDGTNLWATPTVLKVLAATEIERDFGRQLIREAPDLLLAYVGAEHEETRQIAIDLLKIVSGEDFGRDPQAWSDWLSAPPGDS